jgi:formiminoglutamate deiminase
MIHARRALLPSGWGRDVRVTLDGQAIAGVAVGVPPLPGDMRVDTLLPAPGNLHSHSFQRAMAGLTEHRARGRESFWTWRDLMYRFLDRLTPEDVEAVAAQVFVEMLEAGYAAVGEFHYVHHQPGGAPYADCAELSARVMAAAAAAGIGLTHLPVLYTYGGAGEQALSGGQLRFGNGVAGFARLLEAAGGHAKALPPDTRIGLAPHSLRAVSPRVLAEALPLARGGPVHIHVAEQPKEVADIQGWLGARPVEWLLANAPVGPGWCAIHATHMTEAEVAGLARSGAVAGLCPITEANLGDGPFAGPLWLAEDGSFGVGSDSNVLISLTEELRTLEYSQRLRDLARTVLAGEEGSVGEYVYRRASLGSAQALGRASGEIAAGRLADLVALDCSGAGFAGVAEERVIDTWVFATPGPVVAEVWSAGRHVVRAGRHEARERVTEGFRRALTRLRGQV